MMSWGEVVSGKAQYKHIYCFDFEFVAEGGNRPRPICLVIKDLVTGEENRIWEDELNSLKKPPFEKGEDSLYVAYFASAELGCYLSLGWPLPKNVLDLFVEFRCLTNGLKMAQGSGLLGALSYFGIDGLSTTEKTEMRDLILSGGPWSVQEVSSIFEYCASDVNALEKLLPKMWPTIDLERALLRGRYMKAVAHMEDYGVSIDGPQLERLRHNWGPIQERLIEAVDKNFGIYEGRTFKTDRFEKWLLKNNISWPITEKGKLDLREATFREMARSNTGVAQIHELRTSMAMLRLSSLEVGADSRNRCLLSPFRSRTGRNQPSNSKFIFGPSAWVRSLIRPKKGNSIAYIDWSQQEFGIAAALSGDESMMLAYSSDDPYLTFAKQAGAVPENATKETHEKERSLFKACVLAVQYGMGEVSLARRIGRPTVEAKKLLDLHRRIYKKFWHWSDSALDFAMAHGFLLTTFGWRIRLDKDPNPRSIQNFPMQANGAEMLRLACCFAIEDGVQVCAPVHDAILIEAPTDEIEETCKRTQAHMARASRIILSGFELATDVELFKYPDRYVDKRGITMWGKVWDIVNQIESENCNLAT